MTNFSVFFACLSLAAGPFLLFIATLHLLVALALWPLSLIISITPMASILEVPTPEVSTPGPQAAQATIPTVEELVDDQSFYIQLCEEQSEVFRQNSEEFTREYNIYTQSAEVAKPGQNWQPTPQDRDAFVAEMKRRCQQVPQSIAE